MSGSLEGYSSISILYLFAGGWMTTGSSIYSCTGSSSKDSSCYWTGYVSLGFSMGGKPKGAKGLIRYSSPSDLRTNLSQPCASSHIFCSEAYWVEVNKYSLWSGLVLRCLIFYLQLSICQHLIQSTSRFDFFFMSFNFLMNESHSWEFLLIIYGYWFLFDLSFWR